MRHVDLNTHIVHGNKYAGWWRLNNKNLEHSENFKLNIVVGSIGSHIGSLIYMAAILNIMKMAAIWGIF